MKFQTVKKGYDPSAVDEYINNNNAVIAEQKAEIEELKKQNEALAGKLDDYNKKKDEILSVIQEAREHSAARKRKAGRLFEEEINRIKTFRDKWTAYAAQVVKAMAPSEAEKFNTLSRKFDAALNRYAKCTQAPETSSIKEKEEESIELKKAADLIGKFAKEDILPSVAAVTDSSDLDRGQEISVDISQEEILNVNKSLEELCKDLGIIDK